MMIHDKASNYMGRKRNYSYLICFLHFLHFSCLIHCLKSNLDASLEAILHDHAFRLMLHRRPHTGALYDASLPPNLAGIKVSAVGLRSTSLWRNGANFSDFVIPPRTLPVPYVKRLLIVYHNLGNCSSSYYTLSGYSLKTPVIGFLVYDASRFSSSNSSRIELNTRGKPILVEFQNSTLIKQRGKCAFFGAVGEISISEMSAPNVCCSRNQGHFSIVVPSKKQQTWPFWIMGFLAGFVGLILIGLAAAVALRSFLGKRTTQEMEKGANEGEYLQTYWIRMTSSKMPRAQVTRTQPILESTTLPNPKLSWYA